MREFSFTTTAGGTILLGGHDYVIETANGMSEPKLINQEQKAPFQDGTTYIDTLLDVREITITGAINIPGCSPTALTAINAAKDTMIRALNPKNGQGWLTYTYNGGSKKIQAIPSIVFSNKLSTNAYQRFQIVFRCNDPMWQSVAATTVNLTTPTLTTKSEISTLSAFPSCCVDLNGKYWCTYRSSTGSVMLRSSTDLVTWSAATTIKTTTDNTVPRIICRNDGSLLISYVVGQNLIYVTSTNGLTWSGETIVYANWTLDGCIFQRPDNSYIAIYSDINDTYDVKTITSSNLSSWSPPSLVYSTGGGNSMLCMVEKSGVLYASMQNNSNQIIVKKSINNGATWIDINLIGGLIGGGNTLRYGNMTVKSDGTLVATYIYNYDHYIYSTASVDGATWTNGTIIKQNTFDTPFLLSLQNNGTLLFYQGATSRTYVDAQNLSISNINITGHIKTGFIVSFNGITSNPMIKNNVTGEYIKINYSLTSGADSIVVNTEFGKKTIKLIIGGITYNGMAYLDSGSTFFQLNLGDNYIYFSDGNIVPYSIPTISYSERYIGA